MNRKEIKPIQLEGIYRSKTIIIRAHARLEKLG